jgi:hypothetical protein
VARAFAGGARPARHGDSRPTRSRVTLLVADIDRTRRDTQKGDYQRLLGEIHRGWSPNRSLADWHRKLERLLLYKAIWTRALPGIEVENGLATLRGELIGVGMWSQHCGCSRIRARIAAMGPLNGSAGWV